MFLHHCVISCHIVLGSCSLKAVDICFSKKYWVKIEVNQFITTEVYILS